MLLPLILARLCGHWDVCEHKLMSLFALGSPRVASCENSHQRFPVRPCLYRSERGGDGSQLRLSPSPDSSRFGVHFASTRGVKKRYLFGTPSWPPLGSLGAYSGPLGVPKGSQNGAKMGPKSDPPEILKTVISPKRELT